MEFLDKIYIYLDALLIAPYRISEVPIIGFYVGTFVLCMWCIVVGEITFRTAARANKNHLNKIRSQAVKMHNLSIKAIAVKDKESYRSCNSEANDAFSKYFFNMITQGAPFSGRYPLPWPGWVRGFPRYPLNFPSRCRLSAIPWGLLSYRSICIFFAEYSGAKSNRTSLFSARAPKAVWKRGKKK